MPEGHSFEKQETTLLPKIDFETVLEKGEIESTQRLEGSWGIDLVKIKDDGDALFRPDSATDYIFEAKGMEVRRSDLEIMAYKIDQILEFGLIPTVIIRIVGEQKGALQRRIQNFHDQYDPRWDDRVRPEEIMRAAIFDYLFEVRDRHLENFLIDSDTGKLWLVDHDFFMFFRELGLSRNDIVEKAIKKGLVVFGGFEIAALERFLAYADSLTIGATPEVIEIVEKARDRAEILLEEGQIPQDSI